MAAKPLPCPTALRLLLRYEPETGKLFWRKRGRAWFKLERDQVAWNAKNGESPAITALNSAGYAHGVVLGGSALAHRVAWSLHHGLPPTPVIDHKDGDPSNNRIENLRAASRVLNAQNSRPHRDAISQFRGVSRSKSPRSPWRARICAGRQELDLGWFRTEVEAALAYDTAARNLHGEFARLNFP